MKKRIIALIPARSGSKRITDKNIRLLSGHPLIAYTISAAQESGIFDRILVSTDSEQYAQIAKHYGADVPFLRPSKISSETSPDIEWVKTVLSTLKKYGDAYEYFSILRPTSPFRAAATIRRAWQEFKQHEDVDSLRAVEKCAQHPGKMWVMKDQMMEPLLPYELNGQPWHSNQYHALPEIYVQNASLEIACSSVVFEHGTISGKKVIPFFTEGFEGFDINSPEDWEKAEKLIVENKAQLPRIRKETFTVKESI